MCQISDFCEWFRSLVMKVGWDSLLNTAWFETHIHLNFDWHLDTWHLLQLLLICRVSSGRGLMSFQLHGIALLESPSDLMINTLIYLILIFSHTTTQRSPLINRYAQVDIKPFREEISFKVSFTTFFYLIILTAGGCHARKLCLFCRNVPTLYVRAVKAIKDTHLEVSEGCSTQKTCATQKHGIWAHITVLLKQWRSKVLRRRKLAGRLDHTQESPKRAAPWMQRLQFSAPRRAALLNTKQLLEEGWQPLFPGSSTRCWRTRRRKEMSGLWVGVHMDAALSFTNQRSL